MELQSTSTQKVFDFIDVYKEYTHICSQKHSTIERIYDSDYTLVTRVDRTRKS